jgi:hypothetical protein
VTPAHFFGRIGVAINDSTDAAMIARNSLCMFTIAVPFAVFLFG